MNKKQKITMVIGLLVLISMVIYPPYIRLVYDRVESPYVGTTWEERMDILHKIYDKGQINPIFLQEKIVYASIYNPPINIKYSYSIRGEFEYSYYICPIDFIRLFLQFGLLTVITITMFLIFKS